MIITEGQPSDRTRLTGRLRTLFGAGNPLRQRLHHRRHFAQCRQYLDLQAGMVLLRLRNQRRQIASGVIALRQKQRHQPQLAQRLQRL